MAPFWEASLAHLLIRELYLIWPMEKDTDAELATVCLLHLTFCPLALLNNRVIALCQ